MGVLDKTAAILDIVEMHPMTTAELARRMDMTVSTTHRLVRALQTHDFLVKERDGTLKLGSRVSATQTTRLLVPLMTRLRDETGASTQLWTRQGDQRLCVFEVEALSEVRVSVPAGVFLPLDTGGSAADVLLGRPVAFGKGWIESYGGRVPGACSVSAPVVVGERVAAALCVSIPIRPDGVGPGELFGERVVATAEAIAKTLEDNRAGAAQLFGA